MNMINEFRAKVDILLSEEKDDVKKIKLSLIKKILLDENCFFYMTMNDALNILHDLGYNNVASLDIYKKLISKEEYLKLKED